MPQHYLRSLALLQQRFGGGVVIEHQEVIHRRTGVELLYTWFRDAPGGTSRVMVYDVGEDRLVRV